MHCTRHRVFLAALIVAAKYLNDSSPKNKYWNKYAGLFSLAETSESIVDIDIDAHVRLGTLC
jgi:G1/S-specific cyclin PLC1